MNQLNVNSQFKHKNFCQEIKKQVWTKKLTNLFFILIFSLGFSLSHAQTWSEIQKVLASDGAASDQLGTVLAMEGDVAVIGAPNDDTNGNNSGSAYIYRRVAGVWTQEQELFPSAFFAAQGLFGSSVDIDGDVVIIGGPGYFLDIGSAWIFRYDPITSSWLEEAQLEPFGASPGDEAGFDVGISGDVAIVSQQFVNSGFSGAVTVYRNNGGVWTEEATLQSTAAGDSYATSIDIDDDVIIVGAPLANFFDGAVYVYRDNGNGAWSLEQTIQAAPSSFQSLGAFLDIDGDRFITSSPILGTVSIYHESIPGSWSVESVLSIPGTGTGFGNSVDIQNQVAIVGAPNESNVGTNDGSAYIYSLPCNSSSWALEQKITASDASSSDNFGSSVAISNGTALSGAENDDDNGLNSGSAYFYDVTIPTVSLNITSIACDDNATPCDDTDDKITFIYEIVGDTISQYDLSFSNSTLPITNISGGVPLIFFGQPGTAGGGDFTITATNTCNNSTGTITATVIDPGSCSIDSIPPVCTAMDISIVLDANASASITAADLDNGSSDNCGIVSSIVTPNTFDCTDQGANTVTLTQTDASGNVSTCTATVTVEVNVTAQPGNFYDLNTCQEVPCPAGTFQDESGKLFCKPCLAGTFNEVVGATSCTSCPAGTFSAVEGATACTSCPVGTFNDLEGATACSSCPIGTFSDVEGAIACSSCPAGTFSDIAGAEVCISCVLANGCTDCDVNSGDCTDCPAGNEIDPNGTDGCKPCDAGFYNPAAGGAPCVPCVLGNGCLECDPVTGDCLTCPSGFELDPNDPTSCIEIINTPPEINCPSDLILAYSGLTAQDAAIQAWLATASGTVNGQTVSVTNDYDVNAFSQCQGFGSQTVTFSISTGLTCTADIIVTFIEPTCTNEGFESLNTGDIVSNQLSGVTVFGASNDNPGNLAMIFDSFNPTGGDNDLSSAVHGKVLIISEDGDSSDPDDEAHGGTITFTFDTPQYVGEIGLLDIENTQSNIQLFDAADNLIQQVDIPNTGDGGDVDMIINLEDVKRIDIVLDGSGAVTGICSYDQDLIPLCEDIGCKARPACAAEDFEIFQAGDIVSNQLFGTSIYGFANSNPGTNAAMIFDSENPTGGDNDLATTDDGFVLILSEDGDSSDPDDDASGGILEFTFTTPQYIDHITLLDIEGNNSKVRLISASGSLIQEISIPSMGNGNQAQLDIDVDDVAKMEIHFHTSGAVIDYCTYDSGSLVDCPPVTCNVQVLFSDFEGNVNGGYGVWIDGGSDATHHNFGSPRVKQSSGVRLRDNSGTSKITSQQYDLSTYESLTLDFTYYSQSVENGEDFFFEISNDGGSTYTIVEDWVRGPDFKNNTRYYETLDIAGPFSDNVRFRFRADFGVNNDRVYIDDILIEGCTTTPQPALRMAPQENLTIAAEDLQQVELEELVLYPVPVQDFLNAKGIDNVPFQIFSIHGKLIMESTYTAPIDLSSLESGSYFLRALDGRTAKFIKLSF